MSEGPSFVRFVRFVALGDSQTEGLNDGDAATGYAGWADRFARRLAETTSPDLTYANLAVNGARVAQVVRDQLPAALALEPDLACVVAGMNDVLRHDFDLAATLAGLEECVEELSATGCRVLLMTFPDVARMLPVMSWLRPREARLNAGLTALAERSGADLLDLFPLPLCGDPAMWSHDRIHGSTLGHTRIAEGMAELLGLPADPHWAEPSSRVRPYLVPVRDAWWAATFVAPFLYRMARGRGPSVGRSGKQPTLEPVIGPVVRRSPHPGPSATGPSPRGSSAPP